MTSLEEFYLSFVPRGSHVSSIPLKNLSFKANATEPHAQNRKPTVRSAAALAAAASASAVEIDIGARIPRHLHHPAGVVENGAARDIVKAQMANVMRDENNQEVFVLTRTGVESIFSLTNYGKTAL